MPKKLIFPVVTGENIAEAQVFYLINKEGKLRVVTKRVDFINFSPFDLLKFLRAEDVISDENHWEQDGTIRKFHIPTKTSSFVFRKKL